MISINMESKLLYKRRIFNRRQSFVQLEIHKKHRRVSIEIHTYKINPVTTVDEDSDANNFVEQLQALDINRNFETSSEPNHFIFPDEVPLYRRVNELRAWQCSESVVMNSPEYYRRCVRLARANLVSLMCGATEMLQEKPPPSVSKELRMIALSAERLASSTLGDFTKLCKATQFECSEGKIGIECEWAAIQKMLTEIYLKFDVIDSIYKKSGSH